ncbi:hypothetical protein Trydic_g6653 [Trypoxylus dichotomus]
MEEMMDVKYSSWYASSNDEEVDATERLPNNESNRSKQKYSTKAELLILKGRKGGGKKKKKEENASCSPPTSYRRFLDGTVELPSTRFHPFQDASVRTERLPVKGKIPFALKIAEDTATFCEGSPR